MPLLGPHEKGELEDLILEQLVAFYDRRGAKALLEPGVRVVVTSGGAEVVDAGGERPGALAAVETRTLFTALCYLAAEGNQAMPRDSLASLATEATSATAAQINKLAS